MRDPVSLAAIFGTIAALLLTATADAQQVSPMEMSVTSYSDRFLARLDVANPYPDARDFQIVAYDDAGKPIEVWTDAVRFSLRSGARRRVLISAAFDGERHRRVLVCAETVHPGGEGATIRAQVCSKVKGQKL